MSLPASAPSAELDVFNCPLSGVNLIEASAGTGKTWNICALYVRLVLEKSLDAQRILVVTFTKAATAELRERIRERLAMLVHALEARERGGAAAPAGAEDPFVAALFDSVIDVRVTRRDALLLLRRALAGFDQAAVHTIHAFCQRALQEAPFAAAAPFEFEMSADDDALRFTLAVDFWRTRVEPAAARVPSFAAWLVRRAASPASLDDQLRRRLQKPLAQLRWAPHGGAETSADIATAMPAADALPALQQVAAALWREQRATLRRRLDDALPSLNAATYKPDALDAAFADWDRYFHAVDGAGLAPGAGFLDAPAGKAALLRAATLCARVRKGAQPPAHPFFELAEQIFGMLEQHEDDNRARWFALLQAWLEWAPSELAKRKRVARSLSFDDLLAGVDGALRSHPWLASTLRERYPAALIDEFQDTDPVQFDIFSRIYGSTSAAAATSANDIAPRSEATPLFLVGDPKQAIYAFRAADLHTYLEARAHASKVYTLAVNRRSTAGMVAAVNRLFMANPAAFIQPGLDYRQVRAGRAASSVLLDSTTPTVPTVPAPAGLHVWLLPPDAAGAPLAKGAAALAAARACAAEIVRLLNHARAGSVQLGARALSGADIAVLVQTHRQGRLMRRELAALGVASVELAQASVFTTLEAQTFERVLLAIEAPSDLRRLRAALASDWIGLDAAQLWQMRAELDVDATDERPAAALQWVERFTRYRTLWSERGFAVMWRALAREWRVLQRIAAQPDGERRLTDVNHLAELLQSQAVACAGIAPVLRWLATQRAGAGGGEDAQLRLASDRDLVQIVTVHKSKGLEYPVVFCPFLYDGALRAARTTGLPDAHEYHDAAGATVIDYGCDAAGIEAAQREAALGQAAERARLVYVALTRAVHRCYMVAGIYGTGRTSSTKEARQSVLNWLAAGGAVPRGFDAWCASPPEDAAIGQAWQALADADMAVGALPSGVGTALRVGQQAADAILVARRAQRVVRDTWRLSSFTSLMAAAQAGVVAEAADMEALDATVERTLDNISQHTSAAREHTVTEHERARPDHDEHAWLALATATSVAAAVPRRADDILDFPRGAAAGDCLHRMFDLADFNTPTTWPVAIARALRERPIASAAFPDTQLAAMMARLLADVTRSALGAGIVLAALAPAQRLSELEFTFSMRDGSVPGGPAALRALLLEHGYAPLPSDDNVWRGFMKGFIDLVFEHAGRYWIADWKSNYLGERPQDYAPAALTLAMDAHGYRLQALIYAVALDRYLRCRVAGYDYETHLGGCLYLFVRGVRPDWQSDAQPAGVHLERPALALVRAFDALSGAGR